jgi:hypothetical protein
MNKAKRKAIVHPDKVSFPFFLPPDDYCVDELKRRWSTPGCVNQRPLIEQYTLTIEKVVESKEVLSARLQELIDKSDNHHDYKALKYEAERLGLTVDMNRFGKDRSRHE